MDTELLRFPTQNDFDERLRAKHAEVAASAESAGRGFSQGVADLVQMQQAEILRLRRVLEDNTTVPERYPVEVAIGSVADQNGHLKHVLMAVASDRSLWLMENFSPRGRPEFYKWTRVPHLPQVASEVDP